MIEDDWMIRKQRIESFILPNYPEQQEEMENVVLIQPNPIVLIKRVGDTAKQPCEVSDIDTEKQKPGRFQCPVDHAFLIQDDCEVQKDCRQRENKQRLVRYHEWILCENTDQQPN